MRKSISKIYSIIVLSFVTSTISNAQFTLFNNGNSGLANNDCWYVNQNSNGTVWVGTTTGGAYTYSSSTWTNFKTSNSNIGANYITPISFEPNGDVWLGSYNSNAGVSKYSSGTWTKYNTSNSGLPHNDVLAIVFDSQNNKWIGTRGGGLAKFNGTTWVVYNTSNSNIPSNFIYSLEIDNIGNIWVGTALSGLAKFDGANWTSYTTSNSSLPNDDVYSLKYNTATNKLWIGTNGGLAILSGTNWTIYNTSSSANFPSNYVRGITHSSSTGNTYIATGNGGIGRFDGFTWTTYNSSNSNLPSNQVWSINTNNTGTIWASTISNGVVSMADVFSSVNEHPNIINQVSVFPNPTKNAINFNVKTSKFGNGRILVYDALGKIINELSITVSSNLNSVFSVETNLFSKGIYSYNFIFEEDQKSGKFIVE